MRLSRKRIIDATYLSLFIVVFSIAILMLIYNWLVLSSVPIVNFQYGVLLVLSLIAFSLWRKEI